MVDTSKIICPHCKKPGTWTPENHFKPFCSDRCKLIDLGDWAAEKHRIPTDEKPEPGDGSSEDL